VVQVDHVARAWPAGRRSGRPSTAGHGATCTRRKAPSTAGQGGEQQDGQKGVQHGEAPTDHRKLMWEGLPIACQYSCI
jgi:hypothetical protein